jgi:glycosyltransferase involved in cell wall biosynthesis
MENSKLKILHTISSIDKNSGGTSTYLQLLANELAKHISLEVATMQTDNPLSLANGVKLFFANQSARGFPGNSKDLKQYLNKIEANIFHGNGMWQYPVHAMAKSAQKRNIPYIISPHGMLEPWALNTGKWKKKLALVLFQRKDLENAVCVHATARSEAENIRQLGFKNPIAVIPNGIDIKEFPLKNGKRKKEKQTILFLSRIHPKKGIELLIEAWQKLDETVKVNWQIEIAGNGDSSYIESLQRIITAKDLEKEIRIIGPQFGEAKLKAYQQADLFVLPTYSENFGIVVAEALACGVPVITTKGAPWEELNTWKAGWWIDIGVESLTKALKQAMQLNDTERQQMGMNGRILVEENYSIESVAQKMIELYHWILKDGEKPEFVYL